MMTPTSRFREPLFVEQVAAFFGFETLAKALPGRDIYPPYLFVAVALFVDFGIISGYKYLNGAPYILVSSPTVIAGPLGVVLAAVGIRYMADGYADAIDDLQVNERDVDADLNQFTTTVSIRTKLVIYVIAVVLLYANVVFNVGLEAIVASEGLISLVNRLVIWELGYVPFVVEFALMYFSIHFLIPRRINRAGIGLFYYDPRNMGGFAAVGQLLKRSYYLYTGGLLLYFLLVYGPFIFSIGETVAEPGLPTAVFFSLAWLVGVVSIGYSMLTMHRLMAAEKEEHIRGLEAEMRETIANPYDINSSEVTDRERLEDIERRLEQVRSTRVYPATFTMWSQIALSVLLPQALQLAVQATT